MKERIGVVVLGSLLLFGCKEQIDKEAAKELDNIENQVAADQQKQYEIAKRNGDKMDACVQAGIVAASWLQAENEAEYKKWKAIEKADCKTAGLGD